MSVQPKKRLTDRQTIVAVEQLVQRIRRSGTPLSDEPAERTARRERAGRDFWYFCDTYMPHYFGRPPAEMHYQMIQALDLPGVAMVRLPRGWGKTSYAQAKVLHNAVFGKRKFQEVIGKSGKMGAEMVQALVIEFEENPRLHQDFGDVQSSYWSQETGYRLKNGCWFQELGRGEPVRGRKKGAHRPDLIIADDIEDEILVRNPRRVRDLIRWWLRSVIPSLAEGGTAVWLCTSFAQKSPSSLLLDPNADPLQDGTPLHCERLSFKALNPDGESVWPEVWPAARLEAKRAEIGRTSFNLEFLHQPEAAGSLFQRSWFQTYRAEEFPHSELVTVAAWDPSVKSKETADPKAGVVLSKHLPTGKYFIRHAWIRVDTIPAMVMKMFDVQAQFDPMVTILEAQGFAVLLGYPIRDEGQRRRMQLRLRMIEQTIPKEIRIQQLQAPAEGGQFFYLKGHSDQELLLEQLEYFPSSEHDDGPDALQMAYDYLKNMRTGGGGNYQTVERRVFSEAGENDD